MTRTYQKNGFWFKTKTTAGVPPCGTSRWIYSSKVGRKPEGYTRNFKDLLQAPNAAFEPKDFFEMSSNYEGL